MSYKRANSIVLVGVVGDVIDEPGRRLFRKHVKHFNSEVWAMWPLSLDLRQNILILFIATFLFSGFVTVNGILHLFYFHDVCFDESSKARDFIWVLILIGISQVLHQTSDWSLFTILFIHHDGDNSLLPLCIQCIWSLSFQHTVATDCFIVTEPAPATVRWKFWSDRNMDIPKTVLDVRLWASWLSFPSGLTNDIG